MSRDARFWSKVQKTGTCWLWTGAHNGRGYGRFSVDGVLVYAHRWALENDRGIAIAQGLVVDHLCRQPACVNPSHLDLVSQAANTSRGALGFELTGTCRSGRHDMTDPRNVYIRPSTGRRRCRACHRENNQRSAA